MFKNFSPTCVEPPFRQAHVVHRRNFTHVTSHTTRVHALFAVGSVVARRNSTNQRRLQCLLHYWCTKGITCKRRDVDKNKQYGGAHTRIGDFFFRLSVKIYLNHFHCNVIVIFVYSSISEILKNKYSSGPFSWSSAMFS